MRDNDLIALQTALNKAKIPDIKFERLSKLSGYLISEEGTMKAKVYFTDMRCRKEAENKTAKVEKLCEHIGINNFIKKK